MDDAKAKKIDLMLESKCGGGVRYAFDEATGGLAVIVVADDGAEDVFHETWDPDEVTCFRALIEAVQARDAALVTAECVYCRQRYERNADGDIREHSMTCDASPLVQELRALRAAVKS
jgi:hypothetical protein